MVAFVGGQVFGDRLELIDFFKRITTAEGRRLIPGLTGLVIVKIQGSHRRHDHVVAQIGTFGSRFCTPPRHNGRRGINTATQQLVPSDDAAVMLCQIVLHLCREPALQACLGTLFALGMDSQVADALLT